MARSKIDLRPPSPVSSATDSSQVRGDSIMSSIGSKESLSTSQTSRSSRTPEHATAKLPTTLSRSVWTGRGVERKLVGGPKSQITSTDIEGGFRSSKDARHFHGNPVNNPKSDDAALSSPKSVLLALATDASESIVVLDDTLPTEPSASNDHKDVVDVQFEFPKNQMVQESVDALDIDWSISKLPSPQKKNSPKKESHNDNDQRRSARPKRVAASVVATATVLGKRARAGPKKEKLHRDGIKRIKTLRDRTSKSTPKSSDEKVEQRPAKQVKIAPIPATKPSKTDESPIIPKRTLQKKTWLKQGLYVGQKRSFDPRKSGSKNKDGITNDSGKDAPRENTLLPMPMFSGEELLKRGRDFKLPFDVFSPLPRGQPKPDEWWKKQSNRFVGDAAIEWKKTKPLPPSRCLCQPEDGCNEDCQNRYMLYECDETNCAIGPEYCTNRAFAELKERSKSGKKYDIGVEVIKTAEKGFGVRPCRTFNPGQVIVEYTGEIITQEECERRMREEYKDNECYYLMTFDQNMIIDATRGSIARFVNHSCEPNCRMIKWTVAGKPRVALFAGDNGIMTGEELSYDYNFDPFSQKNVQACKCGSATCRGVLGPRPNKEEQAKLKQIAQKAASTVIAEAREVLGNQQNSKSKPKAKKPKGAGIWGGKWEWVKVKA